MLKKIISCLIIGALSFTILSICNVTGGLGILSLSSAHAAQKQINLNFPTAATTGALYPLGAGITEMWRSKLGYVNAKVQASNGGVQNLNLLASGEAHISFAVSSITYEALHGERSFKNRPYANVRVLAGLYINPNQIVVRAASGVKDLAEFKAKRFAPGAVGGTTEVEARIHFEAAGLNYPQDLRLDLVGFTEAIDLMRNRQVDGVWIMGGMPTAAVTEMCATAGGHLLSLSEEVRTKVKAKYPWYVDVTIPANTYANQPDPVLSTGIKLLLLTDASMPEDLIYDLTKSFWENLPELVKAHSVMQQVQIDMAVKDLAGIAIHPGAAKFYKEAGVLP